MTRPRSSLVSLEATPYYHCISRCVRRAFLFGQDKDGRNFDHRKQWLVERLKLLSDVFAINIAAYAVMSNHYHLVLHIDHVRSQKWPEDEVIRRWTRLYQGPALLQRYLIGEELLQAECEALSSLVQVWRSRLSSISWFMSCLNYVIALHANREDGCTGRFWEGRFKSQALKDDTALLACMAYVDLNPVRAGIAQALPTSDYTSIQDRLLRSKDRVSKTNPDLMPFGETESNNKRTAVLPFRFRDYLELVDWYGRARHPVNKGFIKKKVPALLNQVGLTAQQWELLSKEISKEASTMLHGLEKLEVLERRASGFKAA